MAREDYSPATTIGLIKKSHPFSIWISQNRTPRTIIVGT